MPVGVNNGGQTQDVRVPIDDNSGEDLPAWSQHMPPQQAPARVCVTHPSPNISLGARRPLPKAPGFLMTGGEPHRMVPGNRTSAFL